MASIDELWRQVAETPDDLAARLVLADALCEAGEVERGELIQLQCTDREHLAAELVAAHWERWLGDLALVLDRQGTELRRGTLYTILAGRRDTPSWAWQRVGDHRELQTVQCVRAREPGSAHYAAFLAALRRQPPQVEIYARAFDAVVAARPRWSFRVLHTAMAPLESFERLAPACPEVEEIVFAGLPSGSLSNDRHVYAGMWRSPSSLDVLSALPELFPSLRRIAVIAWAMKHEPEQAIARLRALPLVELR